MAFITTYLYRLLKNVFEEHKDPRVEHYPLVGSPLPVFFFIIAYLAFVKHYGPKWMEKRKPFELKQVMRLYNAVQVVANLFLFLYGAKNSYLRKEFSLTCQPIDFTNTEPYMRNLIYVTYGYYITKYLDLLDTIFFVLRKKNNQITFLHVYHHAGMVFGVYVFITFMAGSHSTMLGVINLFIHTVMYAYYFVTSVRPIKQALWWKRHITQLQLLQFGYLILHFLFVIIKNDCQHPVIIAFVGLIQNLFMFALFFDFYYKAYMRKSSKSVADAGEGKQQINQTTTQFEQQKKQQTQMLSATQQQPQQYQQKHNNLHNSDVQHVSSTTTSKTKYS